MLINAQRNDMIGIILNGCAVAVPGEEGFDGDRTETISAAQQRRRP
jgi:hypothetical protein